VPGQLPLHPLPQLRVLLQPRRHPLLQLRRHPQRLHPPLPPPRQLARRSKATTRSTRRRAS
jgi:hypothetical protein